MVLMALFSGDAWAAWLEQYLGPSLQPGRTHRRVPVNEIPTEVARFIEANLETVDQLRVLLLLQASPGQDWRVDEVGRQLYLATPDAAAHLDKMAARGLASVCRGATLTYRYAPRTEELAAMGKHLAQLDRERPVTLINLLYSQARAPRPRP